MTTALTVLTAEDVIASAVTTTCRTADADLDLDVDADGEPRAGVLSGAIERALTMAAALQAGVAERGLWDSRCHLRFTVLSFIRHCADVDHTVRDAELDDVVLDERWLGRQGESRTAVAQW